MASPRLPRRGIDSSTQINTISLPAALAEGRRLTGRDHELLELLARHQVLTAEQAWRAVGFPNPTRARHRLLALHQRGVLARFRDCQRPGSAPWHYTLGTGGAAIHAAGTGARLPRPADTVERALRLHHSRDLPHLVGVNDFFTRLLGHTHQHPHRYALAVWWPEREISKACAGLVRPDGYGEWAEHPDHTPDGSPGEVSGRVANGRAPGVARFFLEHDTGTETIGTLLGKISKYGALATARPTTPPVLIHLPTTARETHLHRVLARHYGHPGPTARIATSTHELAEAHGPHARIWRPAGHTSRLSLADLAATGAPRPSWLQRRPRGTRPPSHGERTA